MAEKSPGIRSKEDPITLLRQAKNEDLTINVRHARITVCGASGSGKTSFIHLLQNKRHKTYDESTPAGAGVAIISEKINLQGTDWITLDSRLETQQITNRLIFKLQQQPGSHADTPTNDVQQHTYVEEEMATYASVHQPVSENLPDTWDMFTLLDTDGNPELINIMLAINMCADITFIVMDISNGKECLSTSITIQYQSKGYNYSEHPLKHTKKYLLQCLLSSVKVPAMKKYFFNSEIVKQLTENEHPRPVVCIIGTHADILKQNCGDRYDEELHVINEEVRKLVEPITRDKALVIWRDYDGNFVIPIDNTISREQVKGFVENQSAMNIKRIRERCTEILRKKTQYEIPISWFILELELRNNDKVCIPLSEVIDICDRIMPIHRKMEYDVIIEVLKFYHLFGPLLYFNEVNGMNNFVITDPQWLFVNLTRIVMYKFEANPNVLYGAHHIEQMHNGIVHMELLRGLRLDLQGIELESLISLLMYLKIIAPLIDNSYFIPSILPLCDETVVFTEEEYGKPASFAADRKCIVSEVYPLLIEFSYGTVPRGLFGLLIVQLLQDNHVFELYGNNDRIARRCANLISFFIKPCHYVTIHDKISHLELQVRVKGNEPSNHYYVKTTVTKALQKVCDRFNWQFYGCRYGFLCHDHHPEGSQGDHLTVLSTKQLIPNEIPRYASCGFHQATLLTKAHSIWFKDTEETLRPHTKDSENRKVLNKIFDNLVQKKVFNEVTGWPPRQTDNFTEILMRYRDTKAVEYDVRANCHKEGVLAIDKLLSSKNKYLRSIKRIFVSKDIATFNCIIFEGAPGIGKSMLVKDIVYLWLRKEILHQYKALFSIPFSKIQRTLSVTELFRNMTSEYLDSEEINICHEYFTSNSENQLCILIDELDDDSAINSFITNLICGRVLPNALIIVFSQPTCTLKLPLVDEKVRRIEIIGFHKELQKDFILKSLGSFNKKKLVKYLKIHPMVNEISYIPFYLAIVVHLFRQNSLPKTTTKMYKLLILHTIYRHMKKHDSTSLDMDFNEIQHIPNKQLCTVVENLSRLAFKALKNDTTLFTMDEIIYECPNISDVVGTVKGFGLLHAMECYTQQEDAKSIKFSFCHHSVQEYLAAYYISYHLTPEEQLSEMKATFWKFWDGQFKYMWIMFAGITGITSATIFGKFLNPSQNKTWSKDLSQLELSEEIAEDKEKCSYLNQYLEEAEITKKPNKVLEHYMESILNQAKQENITVHVRHTKVMICGASGAGKTCLTCLLKHTTIPEQYKSTDVGESMQIFVVNKKEERKDENITVTWTEFDEGKEIDKITNRLLTYIMEKRMVEEDELDDSEDESGSSPDIITHSTQNDEPEMVDKGNETSQPIQTDDNTFKNKNDTFDDTHNVDSVENKIAASAAVKTNESTDSVNSEVVEETWDVLTLLDTGGQPEFINLLPAICRSTTVTFVVLNMLDGMEKKLIAKHSDERYKEHTLNYNNEHLTKSLLSVIKESSETKMTYLEKYRIYDPPESRGPAVCFAATHWDKIDKINDRDQIFKGMCETVGAISRNVDELDILNYGGHRVIKINNTLAGKQEMEGSKSIANELRKFVHKHQNFQPVYNIPIIWLILELELRKQNKVCLKFEDVKKISERLFHGVELSDDELKTALQFFHDFGVLLYFKELEGFSHYVVKDMNWLFKILTKIASEEFFKEGTVCSDKDCSSFRNGFFKKQLLDAVELTTYGIDKNLFLKLLEHLKIAASMPDEDNSKDVKYFMPCILEICPWKPHEEIEELDCKFGKQVVYYKKEEKVNPLLIKFTSCPIPRGLFCFLVVSLIQLTEIDWKFKPYRNIHGSYLHPFANLIMLKVTNKACDGHFSLSLHDRILYLELQIRIKGNKKSLSIHRDIKDIVYDRLFQICKQFDWKYDDLKCGFPCNCGEKPHMVLYNPDSNGVWECEAESEYCPTISDQIWLKDTSDDLRSDFDDYDTVSSFKHKKRKIDIKGVGTDVADVSNLTIGVDCHRLLWQELNKRFCNAPAKVFVMAVGQQLSSCDYGITAGHGELAAQKTFELVNHTIPCATNYSSKGSLISVMWERLLQEKGPIAGPNEQPAFEKARRVLFVDYDKHKPTELYQDYLDKEIALRQKEFQIEEECQDHYGDQWKVKFDRRLQVSKEYIEFQRAAKVVQPHLDAIEVWKHGPLVHKLKQLEQVLEENARSVYDYSGNLLKYYHVSLQPADWYQWFDRTQGERGTWVQIDIDSKNDESDAVQAALYKKLGGSVTDEHSDVKISLKVRAVQISRPWLDTSILKNRNFTIDGEAPGSWSTGELSADNNGSFPLLSTQMIVAKDITVIASTEMEHKAITDACSLLFGVGSDSYDIINKNSVKMKGTQVIGYACELLPKFPH